MLIKLGDASRIKVQDPFVRYYQIPGNPYDTGTVSAVFVESIEVDFGDTVVRYNRSLVTFVINADTQAEHFVASAGGDIIADYRAAPPVKNIPVINSLEDLLDFENW